MIGNERDARLAALGAFAEVGSGTGRAAYRKALDDVVYKIGWYRSNWSNDNELKVWTKLQGVDVPEKIGIPEVTQYDIDGLHVNAMPYIRGEHVIIYDEFEDAEYQWCRVHRMSDLHKGNVIKDADGKVWIIDLEVL